MTDYSEYRWMACSREMGEAIAEYRHLVVPGMLNTVCGATASHADIWRTNATKLNCPLCSKAGLGKAIIKSQTDRMLQLIEPSEKPLPRKVVFSVSVSVQLVEEKPTEVSVIPVGQMSRATAKDLAWTAINQLGFRDVQLESNGFSEHGAFFGVKC